MKLKTLELRNIRCHEHATFDLGPVTVVTGPNDSGKTTIANAIEMILTGRYSHTYGSGNGTPADMLRAGSAAGEATLVLDDGHRVTRGTDGRLTVSWASRAGARESQAELERMMGCTAEKARLALSGTRFLRMAPKDQKDLLQEILGLEISVEEVKKELSTLSAQMGIDLLGLIARHTTNPNALANFPKVYEKLYDERTVAKRQLASAEMELELGEKTCAELVFKPVEEVGPQLNEAQERVVTLKRALDDQRACKTLLERSQADLEKLLANEPAAPEPVEEDEQKLALRIKDCQVRLCDLKKEQEKGLALRAARRVALQNIEVFESGLKSVEDSLALLEAEGACPKCGHQSQPSADKAAKLDSLRIDATRLAMQVDSQRGVLREVEDALKVVQDPEKLQERILAGTNRINQLTELKQKALEVAVQASRRQSWEKRVAEARECVRLEAADFTGDLEAMERELEEARAHRDALKQSWAETLAYNDAHARLAEVQGRVRVFADLVRALEVLVPWYSPSGFQLDFARKKIGSFEGLVNGWLEPFELSIRYSSELVLEIARWEDVVTIGYREVPVDPLWVPYTQAADSACVLVAWAHQMAFAEYTGLAMVIVDRLEALEDNRRERFVQFLADLQSERCPDHALLIGCVPTPWAETQRVVNIKLGQRVAVET